MDGELTLRDYVAIFRRHTVVVAAIVSVVVGAALVYSLAQPHVYESTAGVLMRTPRNEQIFPTLGDSQGFRFQRDPGAEHEYVSSSAFEAMVAESMPAGAELTTRYDDGSTSSANRSSLLEFVVRASDPVVARNGAQIAAELYLSDRAEGKAAEVDRAVQNLQLQIDVLEEEKREILAPLRPIDDALAVETDATAIALLTTQRVAVQDSLDDELLPISFQLRTLSDDLADLRISAIFLTQPEVSARLSNNAALGRQVSPNLARNLALGLVLGALLGAGLALLLDSLRTTIRSGADVERWSGETPLLASVPLIGSGEDAQHDRSLYDAEIERVVSAVVSRSAGSEDDYRLLVTSPGPSDGKSTLAFEIGWRLGLGKIRTVLIDADLRRPTLHRHLGYSQRRAGLAELLRGENQEPVRVTRHRENPNLGFLPAGSPTDDSASLLHSGIAPTIERVASRATIVVVDSPPVLVVTDAEVIANSVDGVIVVVRAGKSSQSDLMRTLRRLSDTRATVLGVALVGARPEGVASYGYSYGYQAMQSVDEEPALPKPSRLRPVADASG